MPMPSIVLIGATDMMPALRAQLAESSEALAFADSEPLEALKAITTHRPPLVVLERHFAATPRGAALINRVKSDPSLAHVEVRVVSHTGDYMRTISRPAPVDVPVPALVAAGAAESAPEPEPAVRPLDWHGTRRVPRVRFCTGVEILLDGYAAQVVDMSTLGAQALCSRAQRPDQKVRVVMANDDQTRRFGASIVWACFELAGPTTQPHYRVGIEFIDGDAEWLECYCEKYRV